jgi:hypothetical protein
MTYATQSQIKGSDWKSSGSAFDAIADYGWFVAKEFKMGLGCGVSISLGPKANPRNSDVGVYFRPYVSKYFNIGNNFYYTPEIGGAWGFCMSSRTDGYQIYRLYADIAAFEYRVNETLALGISVGTLSATGVVKGSGSVMQCSLNSGSLIVRYYL